MNKRLLRAGWFLACASVSTTGMAAADDDTARHCEAHAATMVAEMRAAATKAMSTDEIKLVRETAYKSCLAQSGPATPPANPAAVAAAPAIAAPAASAPARAKTTADDSFWGSLHSFLGTEPSSKPGNARLRERSGM